MLRPVALTGLFFLGTVLASPAMSDGMAPPARADRYAYSPEPLAAPFSWTGIYVGGQAGGAYGQTDWTFTGPTEPIGQSVSTFAGGGQVGFLRQWHQAVVGAEVSYAWSDLSGTSGSLAAPGTSRTSEVSNLFLATGMVGATVDNMLGYVRAGYATAEVDLRSGITGTGVVTTSSSGREHGWIAGLGMEYGIRPFLSIGLEYNYIHLNVGDRDQIATPAGVAGSRTVDAGVDIQTVMARLNFRFGGRAEGSTYK